MKILKKLKKLFKKKGTLEEQLSLIINAFDEKGLTKREIELIVYEIVFNTVYKEFYTEYKSPYEQLNDLYKEASMGKNDFKSTLLYRQLRTVKDAETKKLEYRLKRNQM